MVHILSRETFGDSFLLHKELPSRMLLVHVLLWSNIFPLQHLVQRRGAILDPLFRISEGFYFGPHHLIMAALLHFEEKFHIKHLKRADAIPLLFSRLLYYILEHIGYPTEPHLERRHHCREHFTLEKWTQLAGYSAHVAAPLRPASPVSPQVEQPQQNEHPTESVPHVPAASPIPTTPSMPEATSIDPPATPLVPPVALPTSEVSITISATEFHAMVYLFKTLTAKHNALSRQMANICAQQDQHIAILRQIHQHLGLLPPPQTDILGPSEPMAPVEEAIPTEETTRADVPV